MLMTPTSRALRDSLASRWRQLVSSPSVATVWASIVPLQARWASVDKGLLTDPSALLGAQRDLEQAEALVARTAGGPVGTNIQGASDMPGGSAEAPETGVIDNVEQSASDAYKAAGKAMNDWCEKNPDNVACKATDPTTSACAKAGLPEWPFCSDVTPWWGYALGVGGAATLMGLIYASYKAAQVAAPLALAYYAPEALPIYAAAKAQQTPPQAPQHVVDAMNGTYVNGQRVG